MLEESWRNALRSLHVFLIRPFGGLSMPCELRQGRESIRVRDYIKRNRTPRGDVKLLDAELLAVLPCF